jgi:hypothetical protein
MGNSNPAGRDAGGLFTYFSGADIVSFFDGEMPEVLSIYITKKSMVARFALSPLSKKVMFAKKAIEFHLIGVNEAGHCGIISGKCTPQDFEIGMSIDELSIEVSVDFSSSITDIDGWMGGDAKSNLAIQQKFHELRLEYYKRRGLTQ